MLNLEDFNESDVREEIIAPLLAMLGYAKNSANDIQREVTLNYGSVALGRRKSTDVPLRGKPDYLLVVGGFARWVLEAKSPRRELSVEEIEQAITYARHPEVGAVFAAITNGKRFLVYDATQRAWDSPLIEVNISSIVDLKDQVESTLSPRSIRHHFRPRRVAQSKPISQVYTCNERITGGFVRYSEVRWDTQIHGAPNELGPIDEMCRRLQGFSSEVIDGYVRRNESGRVVARIRWTAPHFEVLDFAERKGLMDLDYVCLDGMISQDPENPSIFEVASEFEIEDGESVFDLVAWKESKLEYSGRIGMKGQAMGVLQNDVFLGFFRSHYLTFMSGLDVPLLEMFAEGTFEIYVEPQ